MNRKVPARYFLRIATAADGTCCRPNVLLSHLTHLLHYLRVRKTGNSSKSRHVSVIASQRASSAPFMSALPRIALKASSPINLTDHFLQEPLFDQFQPTTVRPEHAIPCAGKGIRTLSPLLPRRLPRVPTLTGSQTNRTTTSATFEIMGPHGKSYRIPWGPMGDRGTSQRTSQGTLRQPGVYRPRDTTVYHGVPRAKFPGRKMVLTLYLRGVISRSNTPSTIIRHRQHQEQPGLLCFVKCPSFLRTYRHCE